jgi:YidC/Oxa1 family membrane protein insertase
MRKELRGGWFAPTASRSHSALVNPVAMNSRSQTHQFQNRRDGTIDATKCHKKAAFLPIIILLSSLTGSIGAATTDLEGKSTGCAQDRCVFALTDYADNIKFYGLASYLNSTSVYAINNSSVTLLDKSSVLDITDTWVAATGRYTALLVQAPGFSARISKDGKNLIFENDGPADYNNHPLIKEVLKANASKLDPLLDRTRHAHLWPPFAWLAKATEGVLDMVQSTLGIGWGWAIVILGVLVKTALIPVSIITAKLQRSVSTVQASLEPQLAEIKKKYDGEQAHNKIMAAHKSLGVTPFYALKPMLGTLIQIPILIAVFNALAEMPVLVGASFLWIENLAYPDRLTSFPMAIPLLGASFNLLPILMATVTVVSTLTHENQFASERELKRQRLNLCAMAFAFLVLFYPFPAAMVLYWTTINVLHIFQQRFIKV